MTWFWKHFNDLSAREVHDLLALRAGVFVVEQNCIYLDPDGKDIHSWHMLGYESHKLQACLRIVPPKLRFAEPSIGRVVSAKEVRGLGYGHEMMRQAIKQCQELYPGKDISLSAQEHLADFYANHGFEVLGRGYLEDGIPHVHMVLTAPEALGG